jgi:hypothetical protein
MEACCPFLGIFLSRPSKWFTSISSSTPDLLAPPLDNRNNLQTSDSSSGDIRLILMDDDSLILLRMTVTSCVGHSEVDLPYSVLGKLGLQ